MILKLRFPVLFLFLLMVGCRTAGPSTPATTVASFFSKYQGRSGFKTMDWSADFLERLALVRAAKLLGGSELTNAITGIRKARVISFAPVSNSADRLAQQGLVQEATGILQGNKYEPISVGSALGNDYKVSVRANGDRVSEFAAIGQLPDATDSFVLVDVEGNFTRAQVQALAKYLPQIVQATAQ
jgi:hypothetical protein